VLVQPPVGDARLEDDLAIALADGFGEEGQGEGMSLEEEFVVLTLHGQNGEAGDVRPVEESQDAIDAGEEDGGEGDGGAELEEETEIVEGGRRRPEPRATEHFGGHVEVLEAEGFGIEVDGREEEGARGEEGKGGARDLGHAIEGDEGGAFAMATHGGVCGEFPFNFCFGND